MSLRDRELITFLSEGRLREGRASWLASNVWQGQEYGQKFLSDPGAITLTAENEGIVWAHGWDSKAAKALRVAVALGVAA
jgi:hypothetical protein